MRGHLAHLFKRWFLFVLSAVILFSCLPALAASSAPAFDSAASAAKLDVSLFAIDDRQFKVTVRGIYDALDDMRASQKDQNHCTYRYTLTIKSLNGFTLHGSMRYWPADASPITRISAFVRYFNTDHDATAVMPDAEGICWIVSVPKRLNFNVWDIASATLELHCVEERGLTVTKELTAQDLISDDIAVTVINGMCTLRITVPEKKKLIVSITDPLLKTGYTNSSEAQGDHTPVWYMKAKINSYLWVEAVLDGRESKALDDHMLFRAGEFHVLKNGSNKYHAKTFDLETASYHIDGDTIVMELTIPDELKHDFRKLLWVELEMNNGTQKSHYRVR